MASKDLLDRVYGCIVGGAIGDALGAPVEGMYYQDIRREYGRVDSLLASTKGNTGPLYGGSTGELYDADYDGPPASAGQVTDDTTLRHYLSLAIINRQGRVTPDDFATVLAERANPNRLWINERAIIWKLKAGMNPWETGLGSIPAGVATMAIAPIGIVNAGDPDQAYLDAFAIASINQQGHNRDAAAAIASGVASAFIPGITLEGVLDTVYARSTPLLKRAIDRSYQLLDKASSVDDFAAAYYSTSLDWTWPSRGAWNPERFFSGNSIELVPITLAILKLCGGDPELSMVEAASFGRDCDTTASLAGSICGAMQGASGIRSDWIDTVEAANAEFFEEVEGDPKMNFSSVARRMEPILQQEIVRSRERVAYLEGLVG